MFFRRVSDLMARLLDALDAWSLALLRQRHGDAVVLAGFIQ